MRVALVEPALPFEECPQHARGLDKYNMRPVGLNVGPLFLAGYLRNRLPGVDVRFIEQRLPRHKGITIDWRKEIQNSDVVAVGCCTNEFPAASVILKYAKSAGKITIIGGLFPTSYPEFVLQQGYIDYLVKGEGEYAFLLLLAALSKRADVNIIPAISYINGPRITHNGNGILINDLNFLPDFSLVNLQEYALHERAPIWTARGCPYTCSFCTLSPHWRRKYRTLPFPAIKAQIERFINAGFASFDIKDESITIDRKHTTFLFSTLGDLQYQVDGMPVRFSVKSRIDALDADLLNLMLNAGVDTIQIGVETYSLEGLQGIKKNLKKNQIVDTLEMILSFGFKLNPIYILGYPGQTPKDLRRDVECIVDIGKRPNVISYISFNTPHPGSYEWIHARELGITILTRDLNYFNHKMPVAVPASLGKASSALELLRDAYNEAVCSMGMVGENPILTNIEYLSLGHSFGSHNDIEVVV